MRKLVNDLSGQRFGRLVAIAPEGTTRKTKYICQCDCGNVKVVRADTLLNGGCKSCGCLKKEQDKINLTKHYSHQKSGTRIYEIWCERLLNGAKFLKLIIKRLVCDIAETDLKVLTDFLIKF